MNFVSYARNLKIDKYLLRGKRGSEENIKIKFVIPLLQDLGWDMVQDMDFEHSGADIVLLENDRPVLIVETKDWVKIPADHLDQCLEYTLKIKTPWILMSSGSHTALYSSLLNPEDLAATKPLIEFTFHELTGEHGEAILKRLSSLIGRHNFINGHAALTSTVSKALDGRSIDTMHARFIERATGHTSQTKSKRITEGDFFALSHEKSPAIRDALEYVYNSIKTFEGLNKKLNIQYRSVEVGFNYRLNTRPRPKNLNLFGVNPRSASVAFIWDSWRILRVSENTFAKITSYPRQAQSMKWAQDLVALLLKAIGEIQDST